MLALYYFSIIAVAIPIYLLSYYFNKKNIKIGKYICYLLLIFILIVLV